MILYNVMKNNKTNRIKMIRNLEFLNKFLNGVTITSIKPIELLTRNRG